MSRRPSRNHSATFKAKVALEALADGKTIAEIAQKHDVHPNQVTEWRRLCVTTQGRSRMRSLRTYGSVRGEPGN